MAYKVNMGRVGAKVKRISTNRKLGQFLASEAQRGMDKYVPYRTSALSKSANVSPFKVTYNTPYARKVFYGEHLRFSKDQHPLAQARWDRAYAEAFGKQLGEAATRFLEGM